MPALRDSILPILAIIIASAILMVLLAQLDTTEWAAGIRAGLSAEPGEGDEMSGIIMIIGPLLKITLLMGIPALLTLGVRKIIGRNRSK